MRKVLGALAITAAVLVINAAPANACAGLVTPGGNVKLLRTATLAGHHAGVEHYVTSFQFQGGGAEFGSIVPLPAVPTKVERGGDWTLQRLERETQPVFAPTAARAAEGEDAGKAEVVYETRIDALDITILKGGADAVGAWAREHGFQLTPDAPEVLDFYAQRSKIFMAARFNADAAKEREQEVGEGTPIHLTIPLENPWVPLRILGLGITPSDRIDADVYLLTDRRPAMLPAVGNGFESFYDQQASQSLLDDLRSDKGMEWVPNQAWLTGLRVNGTARQLRYDLATDVSPRGRPSAVMAGLAAPAPPTTTTTTTAAPPTTAAPETTTTEATPSTLLAVPIADEDGGGVPLVPVTLALLGIASVLTAGVRLERLRRRRS